MPAAFAHRFPAFQGDPGGGFPVLAGGGQPGQGAGHHRDHVLFAAVQFRHFQARRAQTGEFVEIDAALQMGPAAVGGIEQGAFHLPLGRGAVGHVLPLVQHLHQHLHHGAGDFMALVHEADAIAGGGQRAVAGGGAGEGAGNVAAQQGLDRRLVADVFGGEVDRHPLPQAAHQVVVVGQRGLAAAGAAHQDGAGHTVAGKAAHARHQGLQLGAEDVEILVDAVFDFGRGRHADDVFLAHPQQALRQLPGDGADITADHQAHPGQAPGDGALVQPVAQGHELRGVDGHDQHGVAAVLARFDHLVGDRVELRGIDEQAQHELAFQRLLGALLQRRNEFEALPFRHMLLQQGQALAVGAHHFLADHCQISRRPGVGHLRLLNLGTNPKHRRVSPMQAKQG